MKSLTLNAELTSIAAEFVLVLFPSSMKDSYLWQNRASPRGIERLDFCSHDFSCVQHLETPGWGRNRP